MTGVNNNLFESDTKGFQVQILLSIKRELAESLNPNQQIYWEYKQWKRK